MARNAGGTASESHRFLKGPRSTPPGPVGACISENARARATRTFTDIGRGLGECAKGW